MVVRRTCVAMVSRFFSNAASIRFVPEDLKEIGLAKPGPLIGEEIRSAFSSVEYTQSNR